MELLEYLAEKKIIDAKTLASVKADIQNGSKLDNALTKHVVEDELMRAKSDFYQVPVKVLADTNVPFDILKYIPEESAIHYQFVPIEIKDGFLEVGMVDPSDMEARDALQFLASKEDLPFKIYIISRSDFEKVIEVYKGLSGVVSKALTELETSMSEEEVEIEKAQKDAGGKKKKLSDETEIIEDAPVTKIVATILRYAVEGNASDVHIEHMRDRVRVRFRVDGSLNTSLILPPKVHAAVTARIKILSKMRLDEKRKPQDGRFSAKIEGRKIDFRVSTFPSYYGEKVVMRILDQEKGIKAISELGLSPRNLEMLKRAMTRPYGMILISGPTGSGKTTTLYSVLKEMDRETQNVLSLEDPVEYSIDGVSQSQVFPEIGYTFANGLRTTLRQDPDIIMVGEIRDSETAKLAIQAALTGHLVLSTIHTNTATGIVQRLIDMGVDPFLIPPTLVCGIAQRLVRTLDPAGGEPVAIEGSIQEIITNQFKDLPEEFRSQIPQAKNIYNPRATPDNPTGLKGREAVFEMYEMDRDLEKVILTNPVESAIYDAVRKKGMLTMREDAITKVMNGKVPWDEVYKL